MVKSPFLGLMQVHVGNDGALRSVALMNLRIAEQGPVRILLRGIPQTWKCAVWNEMRLEPPDKDVATPLLMYTMATDTCDILVKDNVFVNSRGRLVFKFIGQLGASGASGSDPIGGDRVVE